MERPEYNKLRKMVKTTPGLIVDEVQNMMRVSLYDNGELKKVVVVMKCDSFLQSKSNIEKIMLLSSSIEDRKTKKKIKQNQKMNRITKIREEIGGKQVDLTFYGRFCSLIEGDRKIILRAIKNGRKKGVIGAIQPGRHDRIWTTWSIAFDDLKVGDTVEFSTSGKYNPGFHATEKYVGCVEWIKGSECAIKTGNGMAVVLIKHIERVVK